MSLFIVGGGLRLVLCLRFGLRRVEGARLRRLARRSAVRDVGRRFRLRPHPPSYWANSEQYPERV